MRRYGSTMSARKYARSSRDARPSAEEQGSQRLPRAERREQILVAAARAFARGGYAATSLTDVADEAGVTRVILYRHFDSKADLYLAVLDHVVERLSDATASPDFGENSIEALIHAAAADPDGFRLVFHHAQREAEFRERTDEFRERIFEVTHAQLSTQIPNRRWAAWASALLPTTVIEAVIAWLDAGEPDPDETPTRIAHVVGAIIEAAGD